MKISAATVVDLVASGLERTPLHTSSGLAFVYVGDVEKAGVIVMEDRFREVGPMKRMPGSDVWLVETEIDPDGSIEYKLNITQNGKSRMVLDPSNPEKSSAPFGSNSVANGSEYSSPAWLLEAPAVPGEIKPFPIESRIWGRSKDHQIYVSAGSDGADELPLLILHDGPEYVRYAGLARCLDWLVGNKRIPPLMVLLHQPHMRNEEYVGNPLHDAHLLEEVLPAVRSAYEVGQLYAGGASLGAVASLTVSYRTPGVFTGLMLQSGSFVRELGGRYRRGPVLQPVARLLPDVLDHPDRLPERLVISCGTYDGLVEDHRQLVPGLAESRPGVTYWEINAGHHWRCWRDALEFDLSTLFLPA
jgi:enterochelin esterase family protein